jgi:hypothetical protein
MAVYHPRTGAGVAHVSSPVDLPAKKIWSWGVDADAMDWRRALSDNGSAHFTYSSTEERDLVIEGGWAPDFNRRAADITTELLNDVPTAEAGAGGVLEIVASGDVAVDGLVLSGGQAAGNGGGLFIAATGPIVVGNCQVLGNAAGGEGGGVFLESSGSSVLLHGSSIRGNSAAGGGGVLIRAASAVTVDANEIAGNAAVVADGGLQASVASGGELLVGDNTITGNRSAAGASGLTLAAWGAEGVSTLRVHDNRVYGNATAPSLVVAADCDYIANHLDLDIVNNVIESYGLCADYQLDGSNTGADPAR